MLYRMSGDLSRFDKIEETSLGQEKILERKDLQGIIRDQPEIIDPDLFIVSEEYSDWEESGRSIDLLGIGKEGKEPNLVVVELKRGNTGENMELQAVRYAAMAANMTFEQIVDAHQNYLEKRGVEKNAKECIYNFLEAVDEMGEPEVATDRPRIFLVSENFSKELTTSVLWLNDVGLDIRCFRMRVYRHGDELFVDVAQVIPLPEARDYLIQARDRNTESQKRRALSGKEIPGAEEFEAIISGGQSEHNATLKKLLKWARSLEEDGYARLFSYQWKGGRGVSLLPRLLLEDVGLLTIYCDRGVPSLKFSRSVFERSAPKSIGKIEKILGYELSRKSEFENFGDNLLQELTEGYKEASGLE